MRRVSAFDVVPIRALFLAGSVATFDVLASAEAADSALRPRNTPASTQFEWAGAYFGGHVAYGRGSASSTLFDPDLIPSKNSFGSLFGGAQVGYNFMLPSSHLLLGIEADITFPNFLGADEVVSSHTTAQTDVARKVDSISTIRGRLGYAFNHWLIYGTGGLAWSQARFLQTPGVIEDQDKVLRMVAGGTLGAGTEVALAANWIARLEYLYSRFGGVSAAFPSGTRYESAFDIHMLRLMELCVMGSAIP